MSVGTYLSNNTGGLPWGHDYARNEERVTRIRRELEDLIRRRQYTSPPQMVISKDKKLEDFSEMEIIMELIGRGYAVSKLTVDEHVEAAK